MPKRKQPSLFKPSKVTAEAEYAWPSIERCIQLWNLHASDDLNGVELATDSRAARFNEVVQSLPDEADWIRAFRFTRTSQFLTGNCRSNGNGHEGWESSFDFFLQHSPSTGEWNILLAYEGKWGTGRDYMPEKAKKK